MTDRPSRADRERERRARIHAAREAETLEMLADRLPDYEPEVAFSRLWSDVKHLRGILTRDRFYDLLASLDGAHLPDAGLVVRIRLHERTARRAVRLRPVRTLDEQRAYLRRYLDRGRVHPPAPVSYKAAHARVTAARGLASAYSCAECGDAAAEWSYRGASPDEQVGWIQWNTPEGVAETIVAWSPNPADYEALCSSCHWTRDESGVVFGAGPDPLPPAPRPLSPMPPLPPTAPDWVRAIVNPERNPE